MALSIIVPVYNEAGNIKPLLAEIRAALENRWRYEVIYVDDGSTDATARELVAIRDEGRFPLRICRHARNYGQSAALLTGVRAARAAWIATLDGDGQNDPADIPRLLARARSAERNPCLQLVTGLRIRRRDNRLRRLSSLVANTTRRALLSDGIFDTGCGLKLFSRAAFLALPQFDHMHRFLPALFRGHGGLIATVEVNHRPRRHGTSKYGVHNRLWVGIVDLLGVWWLLRRTTSPRSTGVLR